MPPRERRWRRSLPPWGAVAWRHENIATQTCTRFRHHNVPTCAFFYKTTHRHPPLHHPPPPTTPPPDSRTTQNCTRTTRFQNRPKVHSFLFYNDQYECSFQNHPFCRHPAFLIPSTGRRASQTRPEHGTPGRSSRCEHTCRRALGDHRAPGRDQSRAQSTPRSTLPSRRSLAAARSSPA